MGYKQKHLRKDDMHVSRAVNIFKQRITLLDKWKLEGAVVYKDLTGNSEDLSGTLCILNIPR